MVAEELEKCRDRDANRGAVLAAADGAKVFTLGLFEPPRAVEFVVVVVTLRRAEDRSGDEERVDNQGRKLQFLNGWMRRVEGERESMGDEEGERLRRGCSKDLKTDGGACGGNRMSVKTED